MTPLVGPGLPLDLDRLIQTRLLIQANSGGGKSWCIRRLLEQTHGRVQHLVIDPEGEFSSLREKFDYVLAAKHGGDTAADPRIARLLAERLLELGVSAILDIYDLKAHERTPFVQGFLEALVDAPKKLWHPVLVVVDEAHVYCPEGAKAESAGAVIDLATRGRKRGFAAVFATQRLSKLHKDAAAECNNKLIGRTGLDVDVKRAADELGFTKDRWRELRELGEGEFFAFGPALSRSVTKVTVGSVQTSHPKAGARIASAPPPPTSRVKAMLAKLADLPTEAAERQRSTDDLKRELLETKRELAAAKKAAPKAERIEVPVLLDLQLARVATTLEFVKAARADITASIDELTAVCTRLVQAAARKDAPLTSATLRDGPGSAAKPTRPERGSVAPTAAAWSRSESRSGSNGSLPGAQQRILDALAELEQLGVPQPERVQVAFLAGYSHLNSKGLVNGLGALRSDGYIDYPAQGRLALTAAGQASARAPERPRSAGELQQRLIFLLGGASGRILRPLINAYPNSIEREEVARLASYGHLNSKGFVNALGRLRSLGFIDYPDRGRVVAKPVLFLEGA